MAPTIDGVIVDLWDLLRAITQVQGPYFDESSRLKLDWSRVFREYLKLSLLSGRTMLRLIVFSLFSSLMVCPRKWGDLEEIRRNKQKAALFDFNSLKLKEIYERFLKAYEEEAALNPEFAYCGISDEELAGFGYDQGPVQTLSKYLSKCEEFVRQWSLEEYSVTDLERLYWAIVEGSHPRVQIEYGNDLSVVRVGSGFPTDSSNPMSSHPWNLNRLPKKAASLFHHVKEVIHGVTDPMLYFGSTFSSFAWHVEDHYLYSINYMHGGKPKVWYSVGSDNATQLENVMQKELPELFNKHPDLLHQLVTAITPADLRRNNVPVFKAVQQPGEFVVTFPRGYHGGFNSGFNLAEAVNFAMPDWIPFGVNALSNYRATKRKCAFSHEELMLTVARSFPEAHVAKSLLMELKRLEQEYDSDRHQIYNHGVKRYLKSSEQGKIPQCVSCNMDCYFASLRCGCDVSSHCCLKCYEDLFFCNKTCKGPYLFERVPIMELKDLIVKLETRLDMQKFCRTSGCPECSSSSSTASDSTALCWGKNRKGKRKSMARTGGVKGIFKVGHFAPTKKGLFYFAEDHVLLKYSLSNSNSENVSSSFVLSRAHDVIEEKEDTEEKLAGKKRDRQESKNDVEDILNSEGSTPVKPKFEVIFQILKE